MKMRLVSSSFLPFYQSRRSRTREGCLKIITRLLFTAKKYVKLCKDGMQLINISRSTKEKSWFKIPPMSALKVTCINYKRFMLSTLHKKCLVLKRKKHSFVFIISPY